MPRLAPVRDPVALTLDGERIVAERGEPVAAALVGAGKLTLARSPKFHRPRGPSCMRGACDGCLARVDGVANVMTCLTAAADGMTILSQNTLGSRELDLLRMTDWFFPEGMNHHELFAGVPGVQTAMQAFARRVAGLGLLPDAVTAPQPARRRRVDVQVIGAGPAGMAAATAVARSGRAVEVLDDGLITGGGIRGIVGQDFGGFDVLRGAFDKAVTQSTVVYRAATVAAGFYGKDLLVVGPSGAEVIEASAFIIAAGAHDGVAPFENNDRPGVLSARAACLLLGSGVVMGKKVVVAHSSRSSTGTGVSFGRAYERLLAERGGSAVVTHVTDPVRVKGSSHVRAVVVREGGKERSIAADVLLVDEPRAPAYELCEQAGAKVTHRATGFVPAATSKGGRIADGVWAIGEVTGAPLDADLFLHAAEDLASEL
jgi:sarcosine oxidase subunit alpha